MMETQSKKGLPAKAVATSPANVLAAVPVNRPYFFDAGLRFECRRCGECCTGAPGTIYVGSEEIGPIADHCRLPRAEFVSTYLYPYKKSYSIREDGKGHCLFFDSGCTIYNVRPLQCRSFPFWFDNLRSLAHWAHIQKQCPGIGQGKRYPKEAIMALARQTVHL